MKELDFDELDKAVNSLMSGVPKNAPIKDDDVKTLTIDSTLPMVLTPPSVASASPQPATPTQPSTMNSSAPLAARRAGRFMDVVHPSSDMTKANAAPQISRQGVTIAPRAVVSDFVPVVEPSVTPAPNDKASTVASPIDEPQDDTVASSNEWPDPLDMHESPDAEPASSPSTEGEVTNDTTSSEESAAPLSSPFLSDTKVEKRPLGGPVPSEHEQSDDLSHSPVLGVLASEDMSSNDMADQLPPKPPEGDVPLPEELQGDLMAIESDSHSVQPLTEASSTEMESTAPSSPSLLVQSHVTPEAQTGPSSIPQQYKEEPNSGDQTSGAIFDTASYHQPLSHPAQKKSGWTWVIAVIVILLLGAGGGAALYFLGIV
jgi:hypothetical protein